MNFPFKYIALFLAIVATPVIAATIYVQAASKTSPFQQIHQSYLKALADGDIEKSLSFQEAELVADIRKNLAELTPEEKDEYVEFLKGFSSWKPVYGAEVIEGDYALLSFEDVGKGIETSLVKQSRLYGTVFFHKEQGQWKMGKQHVQSYSDPTPWFLSKNEQPFKDYWKVAFHVNHTKTLKECLKKYQNKKDACYEQWAVLSLDPSLCAKISDNSDKVRCEGELARLTGTPAFCGKKTGGASDIRVESCLDDLKYAALFRKTNVYRLDSDKDGLSDLQEVLFNTSLVNPDTDKDGTKDGKEVMSDSNPLGKGRLGDHLLTSQNKTVLDKTLK